jgi:hypothetical protein
MFQQTWRPLAGLVNTPAVPNFEGPFSNPEPWECDAGGAAQVASLSVPPLPETAPRWEDSVKDSVKEPGSAPRWEDSAKDSVQEPGSASPSASSAVAEREWGREPVGREGQRREPVGRRSSPGQLALRLLKRRELGHPSSYGDEKVANREIRVWHGATEKGP